MARDLPVRGYDDPFHAVLAEHLPDQGIGRVPQPRVDDAYAACCKMFFTMAAALPAVKDNGYVMSPQLFIGDKLLDELLPFFPEIPVLNAYEVIPVYDDGGNGSPPDEEIWCYYSIAAQKGLSTVLTVNSGLLQGSCLTHRMHNVTARWCRGMQGKAFERFQLS